MGNWISQETSTTSSGSTTQTTRTRANNSTSVDESIDHQQDVPNVIFNKGFSSREDLIDIDNHKIEGDNDVLIDIDNHEIDDVLIDIDDHEIKRDNYVFSTLENDDNYVPAGMHCLLPPNKILLTSSSAAYEASGIKVAIQNGTVCKEEECCLTMAVFINTIPCSYPKNTRKISPVLMLHPNREVTLLKPIQITIPHFLRSKTDLEDNLAHIGVLKASQIGKSKNDKFRFEKVLGSKVIRFGTNEDGDGTVTFEIEHFCFLQLYADSTLHEKTVAMKSKYCLCRLDPIEDIYPRLYCYVLTYKLKLFIKSIAEQFPKHKINKVLEFQFEKSEDRRIIVKNSFPTNQPDNWNIAFEASETNGDEVIHASSLERWGKEQEDLTFDVEHGLYPPMFKLQICPKNLLTPCYDCLDVCVPFKGICKISPDEADVVDRILITVSRSSLSSVHTVASAGAIPEGTAVASCPRSQSRMAMDTPQHEALHLHLPDIIDIIKIDVVTVASIMFQHKLIPKLLLDKAAQVNGISDQAKATELMTAISAQVKIDRNTFDTFLKVLKETGPFTSNLIELLNMTVSTGYPLSHKKTDTVAIQTVTESVNGYSLLSYLKGQPNFECKPPAEQKNTTV